jgi:L-ribulose-5-phosphate 4-epimerase
MKPLGEYQVWFLTGSQDLYGEDTLRQVADHAALIAAGLAGLGLDPLEMPAVLVASHGPFSWGADAARAAENAVALEAVAAMAAGTLALKPDAEPVEQFLLDRHYNRKHGPGAYYGQPGDHAGTVR